MTTRDRQEIGAARQKSHVCKMRLAQPAKVSATVADARTVRVSTRTHTCARPGRTLLVAPGAVPLVKEEEKFVMASEEIPLLCSESEDTGSCLGPLLGNSRYLVPRHEGFFLPSTTTTTPGNAIPDCREREGEGGGGGTGSEVNISEEKPPWPRCSALLGKCNGRAGGAHKRAPAKDTSLF